MKGKIIVLAALLALTSLFVGCTGGNNQKAGASGPTVLGVMDLWEGFESEIWYQKIQKDLNVKFERVILDRDQFNLAVASGDLPDIVGLPPNSMTLVSSIIQADIALDLEPYLQTKLTSFTRPAYAPVNKLMQELLGGPNHKLYFLSARTNTDNPDGGTIPRRGYIVRWDYYKEIGAPAINNDDDYLAALKAMQAKHPATRTGKKTYAIGVEKNFGDMGGYRAATTLANIGLNVWTFGGTRYATDVRTSQPVNGYTDVARSHYWADMQFYNKVYRAGLFDPDSYSMSWDEYLAKIADGAYMGLYFLEQKVLYAAEAALDPNTLAEYFAVPSTGAYAFANRVIPFGAFPQFGIFVPKNSKNIDKSLDVLNWMYDPDNARVIWSGEKGVYWDYDASGKPYIFDSTFELKRNNAIMPGIIGEVRQSYGSTAVHPDGYYYSLFEESDYRNEGMNSAQEDFSRFYGVRYPGEAIYKLFREGKIYDMRNDYGQSIGTFMTMPDNIRRIVDGVSNIYERAMPRLIQAATDTEYNQIQQQVLADAKAANEDTAWQWITTEYARLDKIIGPIFQQAKNEYIHP